MIKKIISNYVNDLEIEKEEKIKLKIQLLYDFFQDDYFKETYKNISIIKINNYPSIINEKINKIEGENLGGFDRYMIDFNYSFDNKLNEELYEIEKKSKELYLNEENFYNLNKLKEILKKSNTIEKFSELFIEEFKENNNFLSSYLNYYDSNKDYLNNLLSYLNENFQDKLKNHYKDRESIFLKKIKKSENNEDYFIEIRKKLESEINSFKLKRVSKFYEKNENYINHLNEIKKIFNNKISPKKFIFQSYSENKELFLKDIKVMEESDKLILYDNKLNLFYSNSRNSIYKGLSYGKESSYNAGSHYSKLYIGFHNGLELIGVLQATVRENLLTITSICVSQNYRGQKLAESMYDSLYEIAEKENKLIITIEYSDTGLKKLPFLREKMKEKYPNILHINEGYDKGYKEKKNDKDYLLKSVNENLKYRVINPEVKLNLNDIRKSYDLMIKDIENSKVLLSEQYYLNKYFKNFNQEKNNETRKNFLNRINNGEQYITLEVEGTEENFKDYNNRKFKKLFQSIKFKDEYEKFFESNNINNLYSSIYPKIELDYYELEDNQKIVFNVKLNLNELYDIYKDQYKTEYVEVYRIEGKNGEGLYQQPIRIENNENRPAPHLDGNISLVFNETMIEDNTYKKQYIFGFKDLNQLNEWMKDVDMSNLIIKKYKVPDYYVVEGNKQLIFKKDESVFIEKVELNKLDRTKKRKMK